MRRPRWSRLAATVFGVGYLPPAPGTWGSLVALAPAALLLWQLGPAALAAATVGVALLGWLAADRYALASGAKDPREVVIDEVAGQWLTLLPLAFSPRAGEWPLWVAAFLAFRLFDVAKPWPCNPLERMAGGLGIMADDLMAGVYGALVMALLLWALGGIDV